MFGVNAKREPFSGKAAEEIRAAVKRMVKGEFTEQELADIKRRKENLKKYKVTWIDSNSTKK